MKYSTFERLVLVLGAASVLATVAFTYGSTLLVQEVLGQLMLLGVLFAAVHWGRKGGFIAAIVASIVYIVVRIPLLPTDAGPSADTVTTILTRVLSYGLIGIVGGELASRMKYVLAGLEGTTTVDPASGIYNERAFGHLLESALARFQRYGEPFSVVLVTAQGAQGTAPAAGRPGKERALVRSVAGMIRNDIRLVDEAGRLADGTFAILLPHTPKTGGDVVAARLSASLRASFAPRVTGVSTASYGAAEDTPALEELLARIAPAGGRTSAAGATPTQSPT